jgi:ParB-like chromosome segregation protein Spo0J
LRIKLTDIDVSGRHRKDMGDIDGLARSIADTGLLQPVGVIRGGRHGKPYRLVVGGRRLRAVETLGWVNIPVCILSGLDDAAALLRAERDENLCRKELATSEKVALGEALKEAERELAKKRQGRPGQQRSGKLPEHERGQTRDRVAEVVGMSATNYRKAQRVVEAAKRDRTLRPVVVEMDRSGNIDQAYRQVVGPRVHGEAAGEAEGRPASDAVRQENLLRRLVDELTATPPTDVVQALGDDRARRHAQALETVAAVLATRAKVLVQAVEQGDT